MVMIGGVFLLFFYNRLSPVRHQAITQVNAYYLLDKKNLLTYWGQSCKTSLNWVTIGFVNDLPPFRRQAII